MANIQAVLVADKNNGTFLHTTKPTLLISNFVVAHANVDSVATCITDNNQTGCCCIKLNV